MVKGRGTYAINKAVVCDSYDMVRQVPGGLLTSGIIAGLYSWAEVTLSGLMRDYFEEGVVGLYSTYA